MTGAGAWLAFTFEAQLTEGSLITADATGRAGERSGIAALSPSFSSGTTLYVMPDEGLHGQHDRWAHMGFAEDDATADAAAAENSIN